MAIKRFVKDPSARLDYTIDWAAWLAPDSDSITAASVPAPPDGLTVESTTWTATLTTLWISGGTAGSSYDVTVRIETASGRIDERTIVIGVKEL